MELKYNSGTSHVMKPIRYFTYQQTVWYNLHDYINFLIEAKVIRPISEQSFKAKKQPQKTPLQTVMEKLGKTKPVYQLRFQGELYVDWVIFENFFRPLKPFLFQESDWMNQDSLFHQIRLFIEHPKRWSLLPDRSAADSFFEQIEFVG